MIIASACQGCLNNESISHSAGSSMKTRVWWQELHQHHGNRGWRWSVTGSRAKAIWRQAPGTLEISLQKTSPASSDSASENPLRLHDQISVSSAEQTALYWLSIHRKLTNLLQYSIMEPLVSDCDDLLLSLVTIRPAVLLNIETHVLIQIHAWFA